MKSETFFSETNRKTAREKKKEVTIEENSKGCCDGV
jgi:hypothetical protein